MKNLQELSEIQARKEQDISLLKRVGSILVNVRDITEILLGLSENQSLVITKNGEIFRGRVSTDKLTPLARKIPGKNEGSFDINAHVSFDDSMLENQNVSTKKPIHTIKGWNFVTKLYKYDENITADIFMRAWEFQAELSPKNIKITRVVSPMKHHYMDVKIKGLGFYGRISEKTGKLLYLVFPDGKEIPV